MKPANGLWGVLFELAPIKTAKPPSTLYDVIVDSNGNDEALAVVREYVEGGHELSQQYAGGHSVCLAIARGSLDFVRYFVENAGDLASVPGLLDKAVERLSEAGSEDIDTATAVFEYLLEQPFAKRQMMGAFTVCAMRSQFSAAKTLLAAGLKDEAIKVGPKKTVAASQRLEELGKPDYATLLSGGAVDEERLEREERKERRRNAKLKAALGDVQAFAGQKVLDGEAFEDRYGSLLKELDDGQWQAELGSYDPRFGQSVAEFAAVNGWVEILRHALEFSTDQSAYDAAVAAATYGHLEILELLEASGVAIEDTPQGSNSPLSEACRYGHVELVQHLLDAGADPASSDGSGHDPRLTDIAGGPRRKDIVLALSR